MATRPERSARCRWALATRTVSSRSAPLLWSVCTYPVSEGANHRDDPVLFTLLDKTGEDLSGYQGKQTAIRRLPITLTTQAKKLQGVTIVPPDFRDPEAGIDREFVQRRMGDVHLHN